MALRNSNSAGLSTVSAAAASMLLVLCCAMVVASAAQKQLIMQPARLGCIPWSGQRFHIVVASTTGSLETWLPWVRSLGLSHADVYVYVRQKKLHLFKDVELVLPCNMRVHMQLLQPNKGDEGTVYMAHILQHYHDLPDAIMFAHEHGGKSWHSQCGSFTRRSRAFYMGLQRNASPDPMLAAFARQAITLSAGCPHNTWRSLKGCCATLLCGTCKYCPKASTPYSCNHKSVFVGRLFPVNSYNKWLQSNEYMDTPLFGRDCDREKAHSVVKLAVIQSDKDDERNAGSEDLNASRQACKAVMHKHKVFRPVPNDLWSCCNMLITPSHLLAARPKQLYQDMFDTLIRPEFKAQLVGRHCAEHVLWYVLNATVNDHLMNLYMRIDDMFNDTVGCPKIDWKRAWQACPNTGH